jgi:hypothetical protein
LIRLVGNAKTTLETQQRRKHQMADPIETSIQYIGRGLRVDAFAGQSGDPSASSLLPNQQVRRGPVAKKLMKGTEVTVPTSNSQTRTVSDKALKPAFGMKGASAAARVPAANVRRDKTGIVRATR